MRYYIADLHFFHEAVNFRMDHRGFANAEEMNEHMIEKWNGKVRRKDEVVILGDFSWGTAGQTNEILDRLNGKLYLILGNHDRFVSKSETNLSRFQWIRSYTELSDNNRKVILCHYPVFCYNGQYRLDKSGNPKSYMLHGHVHDTRDQRLLEQFQEITRNTVTVNKRGEEQQIPCNMINCFCMYSDYEPLTLDEWIECDRRRKEARAFSDGNTGNSAGNESGGGMAEGDVMEENIGELD